MAEQARATIEITAEPPPWFLFARLLTRISIDIDGRLDRVPWGRHAYEIEPGPHVVAVGVGSAFSSKAVLEVSLEPNEELRLRYVPRVIKHMRGKLIVERLPAPASCAEGFTTS